MANRQTPSTAEVHSTAKEQLVLTFGGVLISLTLDPKNPGKVGLAMGGDGDGGLVTAAELTPSDLKRVASVMRDFADRVDKAVKAKEGPPHGPIHR